MAISIFLFLMAVIVKLKIMTELSWNIVFIPLWIFDILIMVMAYDLTYYFKKLNHIELARNFSIAAVFFLMCLLSMQIMIEIDLGNTWECKHESDRFISIDDTKRISDFCSCDTSMLEYLFVNADCYWKSDVGVMVPGSCGSRIIDAETIAKDFLDMLKCHMNATDHVTNKKVHIEIGDGCERIIPVWAVIIPTFLILFVVFLFLIKGRERLSFMINFDNIDERPSDMPYDMNDFTDAAFQTEEIDITEPESQEEEEPRSVTETSSPHRDNDQ